MGSQATLWWPNQGSSFILQLTVSDGVLQPVTRSLDVSVSAGAPECQAAH